MKKILLLLILSFSISSVIGKDKRNSYYVTNQKPLIAQPYTSLPLGAIKARGMLLKMLE